MIQELKKSTAVDTLRQDPRHYCTWCGKKRKNEFMRLFWYPLLRKRAWHCVDCVKKFCGNPNDITDCDF